MAGDDQRDGIPRHRLPDIARKLRADAQRLGDRAIGGRLAPAELAHAIINPREKWGLLAEIDWHPTEVDALARKIANDGVDDRRHLRRRFAAHGAGQAAFDGAPGFTPGQTDEHTSELPSLMSH